MKRSERSQINNIKDLQKEWRNNFKNLLNVFSSMSGTSIILLGPKDLDISVGPITYQETYDAVQELKNSKALSWDFTNTRSTLKNSSSNL